MAEADQLGGRRRTLTILHDTILHADILPSPFDSRKKPLVHTSDQFSNFLRRDLLVHIENCFPQFSFSLELPPIDVDTSLNDGPRVLNRVQFWRIRRKGHQVVVFEEYLSKVD